MRLSPRTVQEIDSPMGATYALLAGRSGERPLLDLAQAAPSYPPAPELIEHVAKVAHEPNGAAYVPSPGLPRLRDAFAADLSRGYQSPVGADQMVVTAGCNQAFCLVAQALTEPGDEVIEVLPYYFNYDMWLRMNGVVPRYLEPGPDLVPDPEAAEALITPRTRAIVLVTPGNPSGVTIPPDVLADFYAVAKRHDIALIVDETYRSFRDTVRPAHDLFADPDWARTLVSLHSFSKDLAIPGYRVGAGGRLARAEPRGDEVARLRGDLPSARRAGGRLGRADLGPGVAACACERGHGEAALAGDRAGRAAGRFRAAELRRVLRLGPPPVRRPRHRRRRARPHHPLRHARHSGHRLPARRPPGLPGQLRQRGPGRAHRVRRAA
nr:aminotransferase class I/II-fold pyridoxal phosphate-dependent enzyme [Streptomyces violaceusniger]